MAFELEYIGSSCSSESDPSNSEEHFPIMQIEQIPKVSNSEISSLDLIQPLSNIEVHILPFKYDMPIEAIAFMDISAQKPFMNPAILPFLAWETGVCFFKAADGKTFQMDLITKHKIGIKFLPQCII